MNCSSRAARSFVGEAGAVADEVQAPAPRRTGRAARSPTSPRRCDAVAAHHTSTVRRCFTLTIVPLALLVSPGRGAWPRCRRTRRLRTRGTSGRRPHVGGGRGERPRSGQSDGQGLEAPTARRRKERRAGPRPGRREGRTPPASPGSPRPSGPPGRPAGWRRFCRASKSSAVTPDHHHLAVHHRAAGQGAQRRLQLGEVAQEGALIAAVEANLDRSRRRRGTRPTWVRRPSRRRAGRPAPGLPWGSGAVGTATRAWCEVRAGSRAAKGGNPPPSR